MSDNRQETYYGCGDSLCVFGPPKGQRTNGGCRCFQEMPMHRDQMRAQRAVRFMRRTHEADAQSLRTRVEALMEALEAAIWSEMYERDMMADPPKVVEGWQAFKAKHGKEAHSGDCTREAHACLRCHIEMVQESATAALAALEEEQP